MCEPKEECIFKKLFEYEYGKMAQLPLSVQDVIQTNLVHKIEGIGNGQFHLGDLRVTLGRVLLYFGLVL